MLKDPYIPVYPPIDFPRPPIPPVPPVPPRPPSCTSPDSRIQRIHTNLNLQEAHEFEMKMYQSRMEEYESEKKEYELKREEHKSIVESRKKEQKEQKNRLESQRLDCLYRNYSWLFHSLTVEGARGISNPIHPFPHMKLEEMIFLGDAFQQAGFVGNDPKVIAFYKEVAQECERIRRNPDPKRLPNILLYGETGTGKELLSRAIHQLSGRTGEFRPINCGAISPFLFESELFGVKKGALPGVAEKKGIIEICKEGGTVFLDELSTVNPDHMPRLLRVLQEREIQPIGETGPIKIDTLFVLATNEDLGEKMKAGSFQKDLYDRLSKTISKVPSLHERKSDVPLLVRHFLKDTETTP